MGLRVRSTVRPVATNPPKEDDFEAVVLVVDIVSYSTLPTWQQRAHVNELVRLLPVQVKSRRLPTPKINSTGDGFIAAFPRRDAATALSVVHLAFALLREAPRCPQGAFQLRAGLHMGRVANAAECFGATFAIGHALNWCTRIAGLPDPGQVALSEDLWTYLDDEGVGDQVAVFPARSNPPHSASVKHGKHARFRLVAPQGTAGLDAPSVVKANAKLDAHIEGSLAVVGRSLARALNLLRPGLGERQLRLRVSIWTPHGSDMVRLPYQFQLPEGDINIPPADVRRTRYALGADHAPEGEGPVARAFLAQAPQWLIGLPDAGTEPERYVERLAAAAVPSEKVKKFSRKPRAILAVPLRPEDPSGVACIDLEDPLDGFEDVLGPLLHDIAVQSGYYLAALVDLRNR